MKLFKGIVFIFIALIILTGRLYGQNKTLLVGISSYKPFVTGEGEGHRGFSIDLWEKIARENNWKYTFVFGDFRTKLANVKEGKVDLAIGGITITADRENEMDFSSPTFNAGLGILVKKNVTTQSILPLIISKLFTWEIASLLLLLLGLMLFWGFWLWIAERGSMLIRQTFRKGYPDAVWCAWMIKTTIGFGDIYPKSLLGRLTTLPIFFSGVVALSLIIAPINAAFIVRDIEVLESKIASPTDLRDKAVATKAGTYSVDVLKRYDAFIIGVPTIDEAYELLRQEEVDAVVYDLPGLMYYVKLNSDLALVGKGFSKNHYGFAFPEDSHLQEKINRTLLKLKEDGVYKEIYAKWF